MAAYAALVSLMHLIDDLQNHHFPPIALDKQQVQSLTESVMFLQEFLEGYTSPVADGDEADPLEMRIADAAYAAEDAIESHIVAKIQPSISYAAEDATEYHIVDKIKLNESKKTKISCFINCFRGPKNPKNVSSSTGANCKDETVKLYQDLQKVIEEMDLIKREAMEIDTEKVVIHDQGHSFVPVASFRPSSSSSSSTGENNNFTVCSDDVLLGIMEMLVADQPQRLVIPIVGMGGIGKTTLARTVYSNLLIKEHFDICAWATISQQYDTREILCEILSHATNKKKEQLSGRGEDEIGSELYKYLSGKRFLIVMDDMWSIEAWEEIHHFFPNNNSGSRVLVTTRISQLGSRLNNDYSHQMKFLDKASSWVLFSKTVFGDDNCPPELEEIGKKIVENCRGLPLSIVVVGGILRNMEHNQGNWESIRKNLSSVVNLENDKHCLRLLKLSYNHLPVYLKPCFLYMGVFEEDDAIRVSTLVKLWVCEGFLKPIDGKSLDIIAKGFLKDLVARNLIIIPNWLGSTGNIKSVKVHDLLRDLCLSEVKKEGFYHVVGQRSPRGISRQRRVVIRRNTSKKIVVDELQCMSHVRSIICENGKVPRQCRNLGLLRAFHAYHEYRSLVVGEKYIMNSFVLQYVNLQHLAVEVASISSNFASLDLLWNLKTLIVTCPDEFAVPAQIWKMPQLRHIEFAQIRKMPELRHTELSERRLSHPDPPINGVIMENLQTLKGVHNLRCDEEVVKRIPNIKKLGLRYNIGSEGMEHDDYYCLGNVKSLCKLESLDITCWDTYRRNYLHKLIFPHSLNALSMQGEFEWEEMLEKIGSLPLLEKFKLGMALFVTGKWEVVEDQFPSLKYLELSGCDSLREWRAETEASSIFPRLESLYLFGLEELTEIPSEIGDIPTLQKIWLAGCSESVVTRAKEIVEEQMELQGDQLPFLVQVRLMDKNEALLSLAGPNFTVS